VPGMKAGHCNGQIPPSALMTAQNTKGAGKMRLGRTSSDWNNVFMFECAEDEIRTNI
jgi:hypothetical protein